MMKSTRTLAIGAILAALAVGVGFTQASNRPWVAMTERDTFSPLDIVVSPGDTITWINQDEDNHTVTPDAMRLNFGSDVLYPKGLAEGQRFTWEVPRNLRKGTVIFYHCRFHGIAGDGTSYGKGMVGSVTIR